MSTKLELHKSHRGQTVTALFQSDSFLHAYNVCYCLTLWKHDNSFYDGKSQ